MKRNVRFLTALTFSLFFVGLAQAADVPEQHISIKNHSFVPAELTIPAGQKIKLIIKNEDATPAEFESEELSREKVVPANDSVTVFIDALDPGSYSFFDDFHPKTTTGKIIAQ